MTQLPTDLRETIAGWLSSGEIDLFIGYERGAVPLRATPAFARTADDVERLIWDATCENNLAAFLPKYKGKKVGLMVKPCDARAVVGLMQEGQWARESLRLVGVVCPGVVDPRQVASRVGLLLDELDEAAVDTATVSAAGRELPLAEVLHVTCDACVGAAPAIYDVLLGEAPAGTAAAESDPFAHVREMEALSEDERWSRFLDETSRCNLCYACRNACPLCYCNTCFADRTAPRWVSASTQPEDVQFYQVMRTFHLAGRCVGCGACTRACPQGVNLKLFLDKLRVDAAELYGYEAGVDPEAHPPLRTYRPDDRNDHIM